MLSVSILAVRFIANDLDFFSIRRDQYSAPQKNWEESS
jgi:hypothetical protein